MRLYFPMFVDLSCKRLLFIGAGKIAARRVASIVDFAGSVMVVAPEADPSIQKLADEGHWHELANELPVKPGDFFQVNPGTLHAILGATLVLETQQSSDVTYRVYDFDRRQPDGSLRTLHMAQALDVIDFDAKAPKDGTVTAPEIDGITHLVETPNYAVDHIVVRPGETITYDQAWPFLNVSVVKGSGGMDVAGAHYDLPLGAHFVMPSGSGELTFTGEMGLIVSHV